MSELSRLCFILGDDGEGGDCARYFEKGQYYAEVLCREQPSRVEGHYWLGLNLAGLAKVRGPGRGFRLLPTIVQELESAQAIDGAYDQAGPHRVLGRIQCMAPPWPLSEGDLNKSLEHLLLAVKIAPENSTNHLYLAETLLQLGRTEEAYRELELVLKTTRHAIFPKDLEEDQEQAMRLMEGFGRQSEGAQSLQAGGKTLAPLK